MANGFIQLIRKNWKENLYLFSLGAFLIALPTSIALISCTAVALLVVWFLTGDYKEKWDRLIHNRSAFLIMSIPVLYLIGLCFTNNFSLGIQEFNKSLYWFIFAFVLGSSPPITYKNSFRLLSIYILAVSIAAGASIYKLFCLEAALFFDFRSVTWIDHIPFSFQIAFTIWLVIYFIYTGKLSTTQKTFLSLLVVFLIIALLSLRSINGYLYFWAMSITALLRFIWNANKRIKKIAYLSSLFLLLTLPSYYTYYCVKEFYNTVEYKVDEIDRFTANGNLYKHNFDNKSKENGNYIFLFICEEELIPLWNLHSSIPYKSKTTNGFSFCSVVFRYMTSKGLRKDAEGFAQLTPKDIENIEKEIPNYIYVKNKFSIYPRIYESIWEIDQYRLSKDPNGKSFAQRIELVTLAIDIIKKNLWTGIGLGNSSLAYDEVFLESGSKLASQKTGSSHNQYLNYLIRFGLFGTLYIFCVLFFVFFKERKNNAFLITIFFTGMLVANFGDANWETFIGLNFFAFFFCFLLWVAPKDIYEP
ncbi:MAG: O-antigen ligase family protein [Bacteroidales bacterium]|jgi:hypothetical protein|nr:O-antigen ligase family protein [Bacteroidales bacterium]